MAMSLEFFLQNFLRSFPEPFSAREMFCMLNAIDKNFSLEELTEFLDSDPRVFALQRKMYITRAGAFSGKIFSFKLSQKEIENKIFVPGDRCLPFVDQEQLSFCLEFEFLDKRLKTKTIELDKNFALSLFSLYGEEYSVQYIASDPACKNLHIAENDFELPQKVRLTGIDISPLFKDEAFKKSGRILARVKDWNAGLVEIFPCIERKENPFAVTEADFARQKWNETLEEALLDSFEKMGPCACIEQQLANVFYEHSKELCVQECGSIHEFLSWSKKISVEFFGVETRLWYKDQEIPAVGKWNMNVYGAGSEGNLPYFTMPDFLLDCYLKDFLYKKNDNLKELVKKLVPEEAGLSAAETDLVYRQVVERNAVVRKTYNWFADFAFGEIRHKALDLYSKVENFVGDIDCNDKEFRELPQQELVTLSQLFTHVSRILEITTNDLECADDETYAMRLSLEGMEANFEEIKPMISSALEKLRKKRFNVI